MAQSDYHKYVIQDGKFVGRFEEMYQNCADPWPETEDDLENNPVSSQMVKIIKNENFKKIFSVGIGKGFHATWIQKYVPEATIEGCDISQTAVDYCRQHYPMIKNHCLSIEQFMEKRFDFDVIIFREILWYILPQWKSVLEMLSKNYRGKHMILEISCYDDQKYGTEFFEGPDDIIKKFPFQIKQIIRYHLTRQQRQGMIGIYAVIN